MKIRKSQLITTFLVGFAASTISGGSPMVLTILLALSAAGAIAWTCLDLTWHWPQANLSLWKHFENSESAQIPREAFVLGIGHQIKR